MIGFIKRLWRDRRGNALLIAGAGLPLLIGSAGLAVDTIQWAMWKRQLQRAADSAAFAGVYAAVQDNAGMTPAQAVANDLTKNNTTGIALLTNYPQIAYPTGTGYTHAVQVTLAVQKTLGFSSLFMSSAPIITTSATAALVEAGHYCVVALSPEGSALSIGGSAHVTMDCGAISNSLDGTDSVGVNGDAHWFAATPVAGAGGISSTINGTDTVLENQSPMEDPFASLSTEIPSGMSCTNTNSHIVSHEGPQGEGGVVTLSPGCYSNFQTGNHTYILQPGVYYLDEVNLSLTGQTRIEGEGVTIILTGDDPGSVSMAGTSSMDITAPTSGEYMNMAIIQAPNADLENNNTINGDNMTAIDGAIYFPSGDVTFTGSTAQAFQCAMIVAYTVEFTGNATVQNDMSPTECDADMTVPHKQVRLIA